MAKEKKVEKKVTEKKTVEKKEEQSIISRLYDLFWILIYIIIGIFIVGFICNRTYGTIEHHKLRPLGKIISVQDDLFHYHLYCRQDVEHPSTTILFEPGVSGFHLSFYNVFKNLKNYRVCIYDRVGKGFSVATNRTHPLTKQIHEDPQLQLNHLKVLLKEANVEKLVIIGHQFGGLFAVNYALQNPENVVGLLLLDPLVDQEGDLLTSQLSHQRNFVNLGLFMSITGALRFATVLNIQLPSSLLKTGSFGNQIIKDANDLQLFNMGINKQTNWETAAKQIDMVIPLTKMAERLKKERDEHLKKEGKKFALNSIPIHIHLTKPSQSLMNYFRNTSLYSQVSENVIIFEYEKSFIENDENIVNSFLKEIQRK